eukprot:CAMPEP_0194126244 /NCGR_PEP_ID=MMETSP0150-20130528/59886_1 /TAXON_ID=122233 /ORGANISM="Chaetoceros debilis, Strain MM31A-1" /LENGTH=319 /DNA_ID=CAMNT_0038820095 /DNA_START=108 /DNA_END=1068 /DNA_ORIENTATION=+
MSTTNEKKRKVGDSDVAEATNTNTNSNSNSNSNGKSKKKKSELKSTSTISSSNDTGAPSSDNVNGNGNGNANGNSSNGNGDGNGNGNGGESSLPAGLLLTVGHPANGNSSNGNGDGNANDNASFKPLTLKQIRTKIDVLRDRVPIVPAEGIDPSDTDAVREWASTLQAIIEEFNLLLCCVSASTYKWGSDRSGAADQNLGMLSSELGNAQDQITTSITPRLTNVLAPVVELVRYATVVEPVPVQENGSNGSNGQNKKVHQFRTLENDPAFVHLCRTILCRNAGMMRCVFLTNVIKVGKCIDDYLKATKKDSSNNRNFAY